MKIPHDPDEILAVVDDNDNMIGKATRRDIHKQGLLHREVFVIFINSAKEILLQKRDSLEWDSSVGGHFSYEDDYIDAAVRETKEEIGVEITRDDLIYLGKVRRDTTNPGKINNRFAVIFLVRKDFHIEDFTFDPNEIVTLKYFSKKELIAALSASPMTGMGKQIISEFILPLV